MTLPVTASGETKRKELVGMYGARPPQVHAVPMLWAVSRWELRRVAASRSAWIGAGVAFIFFVLITLLFSGRALTLAYDNTWPPSTANDVSVSGLSAWGMLIILPKYPLLILGLFLPFIAAEGVAHDSRRRTADMLMATRVPSWAYVVGRFVAVLALSIGLALLMLAAITGSGIVLHLWLGYPAPNLVAIVALWAVAVLPATVLVTGLGFALGTLFPRHSNAVKAAVIVFWVLSQFSAAIWEHTGSPYTEIDPAGIVMSQVVQGPYAERFYARIASLAQAGAAEPGQQGQQGQLQPVTRDQAEQAVREIEQMLPDLWPWVPPRAIYAGIGLGLVLLATLRFRRFRNT